MLEHNAPGLKFPPELGQGPLAYQQVQRGRQADIPKDTRINGDVRETALGDDFDAELFREGI